MSLFFELFYMDVEVIFEAVYCPCNKCVPSLMVLEININPSYNKLFLFSQDTCNSNVGNLYL